MRILIAVLSMLILSSCTKNEKVKINMMAYPETKKVEVVDDYFGTKITDSYRWLENDTSKETADWVKAQNAVNHKYLLKMISKRG
jgi:prolyl oligopeptidase